MGKFHFPEKKALPVGKDIKLLFFLFYSFSQVCFPLPLGKGTEVFSGHCSTRQDMMNLTSQQTGSSTEDTQKLMTINDN